VQVLIFGAGAKKSKVIMDAVGFGYHEISVTPVKLAVARGVIVETKEAIDEACATEKFACNKTKLCDWCFHKSYCPAHQ
jgi:hypothetical protein